MQKNTVNNLNGGDDIISRRAALNALSRGSGCGASCHRAIKALPPIDAIPVVHGQWIYHIDDLFPAESTQECNQCHKEQPLTCDDNFCPHCGAKMDVNHEFEKHNCYDCKHKDKIPDVYPCSYCAKAKWDVQPSKWELKEVDNE